LTCSWRCAIMSMISRMRATFAVLQGPSKAGCTSHYTRQAQSQTHTQELYNLFNLQLQLNSNCQEVTKRSCNFAHHPPPKEKQNPEKMDRIDPSPLLTSAHSNPVASSFPSILPLFLWSLLTPIASPNPFFLCTTIISLLSRPSSLLAERVHDNLLKLCFFCSVYAR